MTFEAPHDLRGIIFDKDGTLFDFHQTWSSWTGDFIADLSENEPDTMAALSKALHYDLAERTIKPSSPLVAGTMEVAVDAARSAIPNFSEAAFRQRIIRCTGLVPQVPAVPLAPLMELLRASGYQLGVATNDSEHPARDHLQRAGIIDYFCYIVGYDSGLGEKPAAGMLEGFCRQTNIPPRQCAMVGDSRHDLTSGRAAGMITIGVLTGLAESEELEDLADVILPDIGALAGWLGLDQSMN